MGVILLVLKMVTPDAPIEVEQKSPKSETFKTYKYTVWKESDKIYENTFLGGETRSIQVYIYTVPTASDQELGRALKSYFNAKTKDMTLGPLKEIEIYVRGYKGQPSEKTSTPMGSIKATLIKDGWLGGEVFVSSR